MKKEKIKQLFERGKIINTIFAAHQNKEQDKLHLYNFACH
jgi:hypothetical protein